jgi:hypothetical protein
MSCDSHKALIDVGEDDFTALTPQSVTEHPPMLLVETHLLELADRAHQE